MSQTSHEKPVRNTKGTGYQAYRWQFTLKMESCSASQLSQNLRGYCKELYFQGERSENGYEHWQGCISLKHKEYRDTVKNIFGYNEVHIEPARNWIALKNYCKKDETYIEGPYNINSVFLDTPELNKEWQIKLKEELLKKPDPRKIICYIDRKGGAGKTDFCIHMYDKHEANVLSVGRHTDLAYMLVDEPKIVLFDIPRSVEDYISWQIIEQIKNGFVTSGKYESKIKRFNKPHVVVFMNEDPDFNKLSKDRWDCRYL